MMESQTLGKLGEALAKAQGEMENASKDKENPFFKSTYADLASIWEACREPLSKNGLCVVQTLSTIDQGLVLTTKLLHASGEWIDSQVPIRSIKNDPQSVGSAITYYRRFSLAAICGIAPAEQPTEQDIDDDDDGNVASGRKITPPGWVFGEREKHELRTLISSFGIGKQVFKDWETKHGPISRINEDYYNSLVSHLKSESEKAMADPEGFDKA